MSNENKADDEIYDKLYEIIQSAVRSEVQRTLSQQDVSKLNPEDMSALSQNMTEAVQQGMSAPAGKDVAELSQEDIAARIAAMAEDADDSVLPVNAGNARNIRQTSVPVTNHPGAEHAGMEHADTGHEGMKHADTEHTEDVKSRLVAYYAAIHEKNQKRIRTGMICMIVIPVVFLILLFTMQSSKIVYLVLWIVSLFVLCGYLIAVEYSDYSLQEKLEALGVDDHGVDDSLIGPEVLEKDIQSMKERIGL